MENEIDQKSIIALLKIASRDVVSNPEVSRKFINMVIDIIDIKSQEDHSVKANEKVELVPLDRERLLIIVKSQTPIEAHLISITSINIIEKQRENRARILTDLIMNTFGKPKSLSVESLAKLVHETYWPHSPKFESAIEVDRESAYNVAQAIHQEMERLNECHN